MREYDMKHKITIERIVHLVMATFALASVSNVTSFFVATEHHPIVALLMALALGTAVATTAIMLTMIDMVKQRTRYVAVGCMVLALVGVSGFVQTQGYLLHGLSLAVSAAMGFGIVFSGECLTAIALSLYQAAERRRKIDEADSGLELKLAEAFADTMDAVDTANSAKYIQRHIDKIVRTKADELVSKYVQIVQSNDTVELRTSAETAQQKRTISANCAVNSSPDNEKSLTKRQLAAQQRRDTIAQCLIDNCAGMSRKEITPKIIFDNTDIKKTRNTISSDIDVIWQEKQWNGSVPA